ncbi:hypothetical protein JTE90_019210 [Oedothorax gibbosus]|uniref:Uncharacterized protein n=1 Tax=Oedothorax gibbosus TaxID=931172 RepID=A0AAV6THC5_9ARAC|nr:hypothetical protein JTE90_019210 [Oedothorax gibbosus]
MDKRSSVGPIPGRYGKSPLVEVSRGVSGRARGGVLLKVPGRDPAGPPPGLQILGVVGKYSMKNPWETKSGKGVFH